MTAYSWRIPIDFKIAPLEAEFSMQLTPPPSLLFRFSALSFNAHLIHLSRDYASSEGHRDMLVHGPLTLVLILSLLRSQLKKDEMVSSFHYRNLAPLYVNDMMKVCGRRKSDGSFTMWIEDSRGSLAVKGDATVASRIDASQDDDAQSQHGSDPLPIVSPPSRLESEENENVELKVLPIPVLLSYTEIIQLTAN